jgi:hypothetical protein
MRKLFMLLFTGAMIKMRNLNYVMILMTAVTMVLSCKTPHHAAVQKNDPVIIPRSGWNAAEPKPYKEHTPVRITVHHEGTRLLITDDAARKIKNIQTWGMGPDREWADIPYHFLIAPNGTIYEGRNVNTVGETNTEYDPTGHLLICCLGNLEEQELPKEQLASLISLIAYVSRKYNISYETLAAHKDFSKQTNCPGKNLYPLFENGYIKSEVKKLL